MMLLEHVAVELIFWVETNQQLKWRLPVSKSKDKFGSLFLFFSFSLQSQMCQKKEHFYHCCQKRDANNLPSSNTSVLFTREQRSEGNRSEAQMPNYLHPRRVGQAVLCFIRTVVLLMAKKKNNLLVPKWLWGHREPQP